MRKFRFAMAAIAFWTAAIPGRAQNPPAFESKDGMFTIHLDGTPNVKTTNAPGPTLRLSVWIEGKRSNLPVTIGCDVLSPELAAKMKMLPPGQMLKNHKAAFVGKLGDKLRSQKDIKLGTSAIPGYEVTFAANPKLFLRQHTFVANDRLYQIAVLGSEEQVGSAAASEYFESFRVTGGKE